MELYKFSIFDLSIFITVSTYKLTNSGKILYQKDLLKTYSERHISRNCTRFSYILELELTTTVVSEVFDFKLGSS